MALQSNYHAPPRTRRRTRAVAAAVLAVLTLTACGAASEKPGGGVIAADADGLYPVTVLRTNGGQFEGILMGEEQGIWAEHGLKIDARIGADSSAQRVPPLLKGEAQFTQIDATAVIRAVAERLPVKIVAGVQTAPQGNEEGFTRQDGLMVPPGSPITSIQDLEGKTVAVPALGATVHIALLILLEEAGVDPDSVEFVALPAANLISTTEAGQVDAVTLWGAFYGNALAAGFTPVGPSSGEAIPGLPQVVWASADAFVEQNPQLAESFYEANAKANEVANAAPGERRRLMKQETKLPEDYIDTVWLIDYQPNVHPAAISQLASAMYRFGFIDREPDPTEVIWERAAVQ